SRYYRAMIRGFADSDTERVFRRERVGKFAPKLLRAALRKLLMMDAAESLDDLRVPPGNRLEKLAGDREGQYSIRVNDQWRVCFRWEEANADDVELVNYKWEPQWHAGTPRRSIRGRSCGKNSWPPSPSASTGWRRTRASRRAGSTRSCAARGRSAPTLHCGWRVTS